jgi:hypothetical protein
MTIWTSRKKRKLYALIGGDIITLIKIIYLSGTAK